MKPGRGRFDVWAPHAHRVRLQVGAEDLELVSLVEDGQGWWTTSTPLPAGEVDYGYLLDDDETVLPDPRSRRQPGGPHGLSRTFDAASHRWGDTDWRGRDLAGSVVYELHVGTFTEQGTLDSAIDRLDHLVDLGIGFVEVMPVNTFDGTHNWGYDGVLWFAVHEGYGGPAAYQRFVDACHARGLGVIQDVVHNHLGPSGNYLPRFGPYLKSGRNTWGDLVNLDAPGSSQVRGYILDNVAMWFEEFHVDGLRLDAVHALVDESSVHLLAEMAELTTDLEARLGRPLALIAESDLNDPRMITPTAQGGLGMDAQWSDDFHHALHVALTGETQGYYADFAPLASLVKVCERGFFHDGTWSSFRGRDHGQEIDRATTPPSRLVVCNQNHDQIGNRAAGDRLSATLDESRLLCAALVTLCSPFTPMLFQGEEFGALTPFAFFTSHTDPEIARATSEGRLREFAEHGWDESEVPDPQDPGTFERSRLDWRETGSSRGRRLMDGYRRLIALRSQWPELTEGGYAECRADESTRVFQMRRGSLTVVVNFSTEEHTIPTTGRVLFATQEVDLSDGSVRLPGGTGVLVHTD